MKKKPGFIYLIIIICLLTDILPASAQLTAPGSSASVETQYPLFPETDNIFIFCAPDSTSEAGVLQANTTLQGTKTFLWEKYNSETATFDAYYSESTDLLESTITGLSDGCYRVSITLGTTNEIYRGWIFNNYNSSNARISNSNCESFMLQGSVSPDPVIYHDLSDNSEIMLDRGIKTEWKEGEVIIGSLSTIQLYDLPTDDTEYTFRVYDRFGCETNTIVQYMAVTTVAGFTAEPVTGEAPLTVNFSNQSINGDQYIWYFYRNLDDIKKETENNQGPVDSIMVVAYDQNPVYTYENSGTYIVKLVSLNISDSLTCSDTAYITDNIIVDTSFVAVPNVFTPNGDGTNDLFVVKFWSAQSIKIEIFNRWGKRLHYWESDDVRGFKDTYTATVWDGRVGGRYASPGVYYYVIEGRGRDDKKLKTRGFFHLFRDKD